MKEFLIGAAGIVLAGAGAALAQAPVAPPAAQFTPTPPMADRITTRTEVVAKVREHFAQLDGNRDGFLTKGEAEAGRKQIRERVRQKLGEHRGQRLERRDPKVAFERLDTNRDGMISPDEFAKAHETRIQRRMVMKDGTAAGGHAGMPHQGMRRHRMGGMRLGGRMFDMADTNMDSRVSLQEATAAAVRHFDMADANRDGQVTPGERRQMRHHVSEKRRAPKAG